ncbi:hypothetical protein U1Q18_020434, partial [Sarracenia purpurea var. burkii]
FILLPNIGEMGTSESTQGSGRGENDSSNARSAEYLVRKKKIEETVMIGADDHGITGITDFLVRLVIC